MFRVNHNTVIMCTVSLLKACCVMSQQYNVLLIKPLIHISDLGLCITGGHESDIITCTYQIQHRFNNISVANLADLNQSGENSKFHLDIPDWKRWIDNPSRQNHRARTGHHHCLSGDCSRVLPVTWRRLSVRE